MKKKEISYASKRRFKHGGLAIAFTAAFIAVVIMFNIGATILAKNVSLTIDLTANKDFSISEENKEYIKKVDRDVNIVVCCDKDTYENSLAEMLYSSGYMDTSSSGYSYTQQYFSQNVRLLEEYSKLNKKIDVEFIDPQTPEFSKYTSRYPNAGLTTGKILVESTFELKGEEVKRHRVLSVFDTFRIDSTYASQGYYSITGNDIETILTSAVYNVTSDRSYSVAVVTANGGTANTPLQSYLEMNNYEFTEVNSLVTGKIPEKADVVIISQPTMDYSEDELNMLDEYLALSAEQEKVLMYIGSANQGNLPNLNEFLSEWGFVVTPAHSVQETSSDKCIYYATNVLMNVVEDNGFSTEISRDDYSYIANLAVPVVQKVASDRNVTTILEISDTAVAVPNDADENFSVEDVEVKGPFVGLGVSQHKKYDSNNDLMTSSVIMLSSADFITSSFNSFAEVGNIEMMGVVLDDVIGKQSVGISFDTRTFETELFTPPDKAGVNLMNIFVGWLPPVLLLAIGVIVYIRRRRS